MLRIGNVVVVGWRLDTAPAQSFADTERNDAATASATTSSIRSASQRFDFTHESFHAIGASAVSNSGFVWIEQRSEEGRVFGLLPQNVLWLETCQSWNFCMRRVKNSEFPS